VGQTGLRRTLEASDIKIALFKLPVVMTELDRSAIA